MVNLEELNRFEPGSEVDPEKLVACGLVKSRRKPVKILANGELSHPLVVRAHKFSASAKAKIEQAGGRVEEVAHAAQAN